VGVYDPVQDSQSEAGSCRKALEYLLARSLRLSICVRRKKVTAEANNRSTDSEVHVFIRLRIFRCDCTHWGVSRSFDMADILRHFDVLRHCKLTIFGSFTLIRKISFGLELIQSSSVFLLSNSYPRACEALCRIDNPAYPAWYPACNYEGVLPR
jgi:hypothetical protein